MKKTKWFRVATEGATTDGRAIQRSWIEQIAKNFNRQKYGARVWLEHLRSLLPEGPFAAHGDVLAVKAETVENGKLALFAQIEPLQTLLAMNKKGQKLYTSVEIDPNFADTGEAYLVGLAVTDSPASLGTEMLAFAAGAKVNPLAGRKTNPNTVFAEALEFTLELEAETAPQEAGLLTKALEKFTTALEKLTEKPAAEKPAPAPTTTQHNSAEMATVIAAMQGVTTSVGTAMQHLSQQLAEQKIAHDTLVEKLNTQAADPQRPAASGTGADGYEQAQF